MTMITKNGLSASGKDISRHSNPVTDKKVTGFFISMLDKLNPWSPNKDLPYLWAQIESSVKLRPKSTEGPE